MNPQPVAPAHLASAHPHQEHSGQPHPASAAGNPRVYLDYAASAPIRPEVAEQIARDLRDGCTRWANPSALHSSARDAGAQLAQARARIAAALGADPHEVVLTSGGTEASALFISGRALAAREAGVCTPVIAVSAIEHPAVSDSAQAATRLGARTVTLPVDHAGRVELEALASCLAQEQVAAVSVMAVNNETGVIQDIEGVVSTVRQATAHDAGGKGRIPVHTDAVAAVGKIPLHFKNLDLDALSLNGHKLGAPVGIGALLLRRDVTLVTPTGGGRQERGIRSGTQDVIGARALALAVELAVAEQERENARLEKLRDELVRAATTIEAVHATLPPDTPHVASTAHLWCEKADVEALLMSLDMQGIDISSGSACHAGVAQPSDVLLAMGMNPDQARSTLRCSLGTGSTEADIERLIQALPSAVEVARRSWAVTHENKGA